MLFIKINFIVTAEITHTFPTYSSGSVILRDDISVFEFPFSISEFAVSVFVISEFLTTVFDAFITDIDCIRYAISFSYTKSMLL